MSVLNNPIIAFVVSLIITVGYFVMVDHYLMDMQGWTFGISSKTEPSLKVLPSILKIIHLTLGY